MSVSVSKFIDVNINVGAVAVGSATYDVGIIVVDKSLWPASLEVRTVEYSSLAEAISSGFTDSGVQSAISVYFSQSPKPNSVVLGYFDSANEESFAAGVTACRESNSKWYACSLYDPNSLVDNSAKVEAATVVESFVQPSVLVLETNEASTIVTGQESLATMLKAGNFNRTMCFYVDATTFEEATNGKLTSVAVCGRACGLNSKEANTAFALAFKSLAAVPNVDLTDSQYASLLGNNANACINVANNAYGFIMNGSMASGVRYDEIYCLDVLKSEIETNILNLFAGSLVVPQTEDGVNMIIANVNDACRTVVDIGFVAPGIWNGPNVKSLRTGDALAAGYVIMSDAISEQSQTDRENRIAPTIYVCIKLAGAVEFLTVVVNVNR